MDRYFNDLAVPEEEIPDPEMNWRISNLVNDEIESHIIRQWWSSTAKEEHGSWYE